MPGCAAHKVSDELPGGIDHYEQMATAIENPTVAAPATPACITCRRRPTSAIPEPSNIGT